MPAKKKTASPKTSSPTPAAKKSESRKTPVKKSAPKKSAAKKTATRKAAANAPGASAPRARKSAVSKKVAAKTQPEQPSTAPAPEAEAAAGEAPKPRPTATELLKRSRHHTPSIFKVSNRKSAPIIFTLEDVREILKKRKVEEFEEEAETKPAPRETPPKADVSPVPAAADVPVQKSKHEAASLADILGFGVGPASPKAAPQEKEVPKEFRRYHELLLELRSHVRESLGMHAEDTLKRSQKEDSGDISTSADAGTDNFDRDFALSVVSSEQEALREIEAAIQRIYNGTYGVCEITGEKISPERLEAVPFTRFSLEGQRQYEATARRRVQRTGGFLSEGAADISFGDDDGDN